MELAKPNKYPPGATLQCACGKQGSVARVTGHKGKSRNPLCHTIERLYVVGVDEIPDAPALEMENEAPLPSIAPPLSIPAPQIAITEPDLAAAAEADYFEAYDANDTNGAKEPVAKRKTSSNGTKPKLSSASERAVGGRMEWRQPPPASVHTDYPDPGMVRTAVELPIRTYAYYEAARNSPQLAFEGTLSEFIDLTVDAFFKAIGYDGVQLVRALPAEVA